MVQLMPLHPKTPPSFAFLKSRLVFLSGASLFRLSWKRGGCSSSNGVLMMSVVGDVSLVVPVSVDGSVRAITPQPSVLHRQLVSHQSSGIYWLLQDSHTASWRQQLHRSCLCWGPMAAREGNRWGRPNVTVTSNVFPRVVPFVWPLLA